MKNHELLPQVVGDIDLLVPRQRQDHFTDSLIARLARLGSFTVVVCGHYRGLLQIFIAADEGSVLEFDLVDLVLWRGVPVLSTAILDRECISDPRGFRRLSDGAEAAILLTLSGANLFGSLKPNSIEERGVREKAAAGRDGFRRTMDEMHGRAGVRAADRFLLDGTLGSAGRVLAVQRAIEVPLTLPIRTQRFARRKFAGHFRRRDGFPRTMPDGFEDWLTRVSRGHSVHRTNGSRLERS